MAAAAAIEPADGLGGAAVAVAADDDELDEDDDELDEDDDEPAASVVGGRAG